jgi:hypothetical protein
MISRMNVWLNERFEGSDTVINGLPSPQDIATYLNASHRYLSDMLKALTAKQYSSIFIWYLSRNQKYY